MQKYVFRSLYAAALITASVVSGAPRVATIYCSWNKGAYSFRDEWDAILKGMGCEFDKYENTRLAELAANLERYDIVISCSVFNLEDTQDFAQFAEPFLAFMRGGGIVLATDASYASTLAQGVGAWSADFALSSATASSHQRPSVETRKVSYGPDSALAQVPNDLLPLAESAGHWAHMVVRSDKWRQALLDSDGHPTLVYQPVGAGMLIVTSYFAFNRANVAALGPPLLENGLLLTQCLRAGLVVKELDWGAMNPGTNSARVVLERPGSDAVNARLDFALYAGEEQVAKQTMSVNTGGAGEATCQWSYHVGRRGPNRAELAIFAEAGTEPVVTCSKDRDVPEILTIFAWKRHFHPYDTEAEVRLDLLPEQPFVPAGYVLIAQAQIGKRVGPQLKLQPESQTARVPIAGLPVGSGCIHFALRRGDEVLGSSDLPISIAPEPYVRILPDRSCRVAGKPFFPIGMYIVSWKLPDTAAILDKMRQIASGGFNTVHVGVRSDEEFLAVLAEARRLTLMVIPEGAASHRGVSRYKEHPAVLAWNPGDEPDGRGTAPERVADIVARTKDVDPSRPSYMTLCVPAAYDRYCRAADILAPDPYPIPRRDINYVAQCIEKLQTCTDYHKPIWAIPQSFGGYSSWTRPPTPEEERNMTYQCLVHGVRGLVYYCYWDGGFDMAGHPELWAMMQRLAGEVRALSPMLLAGTEEQRQKLGPDGKVHAMLKRHGEALYLLAVNTSRDALGQVEIPVGSADGTRWTGLFGDAPVTANEGDVTMTFPALAVRVYRAGM